MTHREALGLSEDAYEAVIDQFERRRYRGRPYRNLPDHRHGVERGTVLMADAVVRGFPKVPRALVLDPGVPRYFDDIDELLVEEKLNGYNARVARVDGDVLAFTRSGLVCPFTTHEVRERVDADAFLDDHPDLMLCGEMVGPENPYTAFDYPDVESIAFRAFDVRHRETGTPMAVRERRSLCERYGIPQTPLLDSLAPDAADDLPGLIRDLDADDREGVVLKAPDAERSLKYTTSAANRGNLAFAFSLPFDYGREFVFRRLVREAFQSVEFGEGEAAAADRAAELGEAILLSMRDAVQAAENGTVLGERHTVRSEPSVVAALFDHLRDQGLKLAVESDEIEDGKCVVTFVKRSQATNDQIRAYLDGTVVGE